MATAVVAVLAASAASVWGLARAGPGPDVTSIDLPELAAGITTTVAVQGTGFESGATLSFRKTDPLATGPSMATVTEVTAELIRVAVRTSAPDSFGQNLEDVVVTNPDGRSGVLARGLAVNPVPILYHAEPFVVAQGSTVPVVVSCNRCRSPAVSVSVEGSGVAATVTGSAVPHQVTLQVSPTAPPGRRAVTVITADRGSHVTDPPLTVVPASEAAALSRVASGG